MIEGIRQPAIAAGLIDAGQFDRGICDLLRTTESDGRATFQSSPVEDGRSVTGRSWAGLDQLVALL